MDRSEARAVLRGKLGEWRLLSWSELRERIGEIEVLEAAGPSGVVYQIEIEPIWDSAPGGLIRVLAAIDDGSFLDAILPLTEDLLVSPEGPR